jgi:catechol 2,3-dioxygenase-like lactoylglutathione lyase family enzyme
MLGDFPVFPILLARDLARSRAFYHDLLGLEVMTESDERVVYRCGGGTQLAVTLSTTGTRDSQTQMAWRVPDLRAVLAELRARGVPIAQYRAPDPVTDGEGVADMGHSWAAWIVDPDANALGIVEPKAVPTRAP